MPNDKAVKAAPVVKVFGIVLITLLILYGVTSIGSLFFLAKLLPSLVNSPYGFPFLGSINLFFDRVLPGAIFLFVAYSIVKLIRAVSRGEPFNPAGPRHIRRIGYATLCLAAVNVVVNSISLFARVTTLLDVFSKAVMSAICSDLNTLLLGFGFLVIAKVIEVGVALKQDQDLTV